MPYLIFKLYLSNDCCFCYNLAANKDMSAGHTLRHTAKIDSVGKGRAAVV
jgi:hypothetical protein